MLPRTLEQLAAPPVPDAVADQTADFAGHQRDDDDPGQGEMALTRRHARRSGRRGADEGHPGP